MTKEPKPAAPRGSREWPISTRRFARSRTPWSDDCGRAQAETPQEKAAREAVEVADDDAPRGEL